MQVTCQVLGDLPNEYTGKRGYVKDQRLTLLDLDTDSTFTNTFDYDLAPAEKDTHAGKLRGKTIKLGVRNFRVFNGRFKAEGRIIEVLK